MNVKLMEKKQDTILEAFGKLREEMRLAGDSARVRKLDQLEAKLRLEKSVIAFCGHFSAGKSTLINTLCGHRLLPSSPIPTSANIVSIESGTAGAEVIHRTEENGEARAQTIQLEELDAYCVNGTDIEEVRIRYPLPFLGEHAMLLDTPGIDSTDDAHHMATESALHLADAVFYVMDYNHVQSEINLAFTKQMKERGKPLYLIVNQIDKHREEELAFTAYQESAYDAFRSWGIEPDGMLFVTMKQPQHPANESAKLKWLLSNLIGMQKQLREASVDAAADHLIGEHILWLQEQNESEKAVLRDRIDEDEAALYLSQYEEKRQVLAEAEALPQRLTDRLRKEITGIIENANVTPALTRDKAHDYLLSRKPGFKVGLFGRAAQTAAEIDRRLSVFGEDFAEQVHAQMDWHLRDALRKAYAGIGISDEGLLADIDAFTVDVTPQWLASQVNTEAVFNSEYTLTYMKQAAGELKSAARRSALALTDRLAGLAGQRARQVHAELSPQLRQLEHRLEAVRELERFEQAEAARGESLRQAADWPHAEEPDLPDLGAYREAETPGELTGVLHSSAMETILRAAHTSAAADAAADSAAAPLRQPGVSAVAGARSSAAEAGLPQPGQQGAKRAERRAQELSAAADLIADMPSMKSIVRSLREKAERLRHKTFTVALFGAFSAGKSSFTNALIGKRVLPVSPNPTTAAINKIVPPTADWPHGTARVKMKAAEAILQDVLYSLEVLGVRLSGMEAALDAIRKLTPEHVSAKGKPHFSFLKAVARGWAEASPLLGTEQRVGEEAFAAYVAEESKSCFVDYIELHYSTPLTEQGIVFVDTPGADSINARHTGVAFDYIKNADAILFVTYYNHAFSQADREFLLQLGRVKDSFELDKMFFLVNAADLAASEEELQGVVRHVETNLLQHGIRHPRIYPVSSHLASEGKLHQDQADLEASGILPFERDFIQFTLEELTDISLRSADQELQRAVHVLGERIQGARQGEEARKAKLIALEEAGEKAVQLLSSTDHAPANRELSKEISELLYYVKQRTLYRFGELYNIAFNPGSFRGGERDAKAALRESVRDLIRMIEFDLQQEVLATSLRIEQQLNKLAKETYDSWGAELQKLLEGYDFEAYEASAFGTPDQFVSLESIDIPDKVLTSYFKNAKQFFEGEGKSKLRTELEGRLADPVARFVEAAVSGLTTKYAQHIEDTFRMLEDRHLESSREHLEGMRDALQMRTDVEVLVSKRDALAMQLGGK
ncbi:dynamin family protein [Paenibacillus lutrae]|uniref:Dynamin family protein n=1 Tax=Paenibacillus lutrae TaxID=2078573 RepID=A0A7X3K1P2_9BACL|nr:dynamin family protein [Paenibacillus lutrae]MVP02320.1 dynamin family protein [Paenibacillus lutrae]